jgi:hypothetical protein
MCITARSRSCRCRSALDHRVDGWGRADRDGHTNRHSGTGGTDRQRGTPGTGGTECQGGTCVSAVSAASAVSAVSEACRCCAEDVHFPGWPHFLHVSVDLDGAHGAPACRNRPRR